MKKILIKASIGWLAGFGIGCVSTSLLFQSINPIDWDAHIVTPVILGCWGAITGILIQK